MKKLSLSTIVIFVLLGVVGYFAYKNHKLDQYNAELTEELVFGKDSIVKLSDELTIFKASAHYFVDSLSVELEAVKDLNADLVAMAKIKVKPDTVYRDRVQTVVVKDSTGTRMAYVNDSTDVGKLEAIITVPPEATIGFEYKFIPNPIDITISLARTKDNTAFFLATYRGGSVEVQSSYADLPRTLPRFSWYLQGGYYINYAWAVAAGADLRTIGTWYLTSMVEQRFAEQVNSDAYEPVRMFIGIKKTF